MYEQARLDDEVREEIGDPLVLEWQFLFLVNTLLKPPGRERQDLHLQVV